MSQRKADNSKGELERESEHVRESQMEIQIEYKMLE